MPPGESPQTLESVVKEFIADHGACRVGIRPGTLARENDVYTLTAEVLFTSDPPECEYFTSPTLVTFEGTEIQLAVDILKVSAYEAVVAFDHPYVEIARQHLVTRQTNTWFGRVQTILDGYELPIEELIEFVTDAEGDYRVEMVGISAYTPSEQAVVLSTTGSDESEPSVGRRLRINIDLAGEYDHTKNGLEPKFRFNQTKFLEVDGDTYPVAINGHLFPERKAQEDPRHGGQPVHTSEQLADREGIQKLSISEELAKINLGEFFHGDQPYPQPVTEWEAIE